MTESSGELTKEQAQQQLCDAISAHARAFGFTEDHELLGDFVIVSSWINMEDTDAESSYLTQYPNDHIPDHIALGLLHIGVEIVNSQEDEDD